MLQKGVASPVAACSCVLLLCQAPSLLQSSCTGGNVSYGLGINLLRLYESCLRSFSFLGWIQEAV